jgi:hypothetical protein
VNGWWLRAARADAGAVPGAEARRGGVSPRLAVTRERPEWVNCSLIYWERHSMSS